MLCDLWFSSVLTSVVKLREVDPNVNFKVTTRWLGGEFCLLAILVMMLKIK